MRRAVAFSGPEAVLEFGVTVEESKTTVHLATCSMNTELRAPG